VALELLGALKGQEIQRYAPNVINSIDAFGVRFEPAEEGGFVKLEHHEWQMRRLNTALEAAAQRLGELKEELAFYAAPEIWKRTISNGHPQIDGYDSPAERDGGSRARAVLDQVGAADYWCAAIAPRKVQK
jgi:hypothetical protein